MKRNVARYWLITIALFALHGIEEITRNLPRWSDTYPYFPGMFDIESFTMLVILLTAGITLIAFLTYIFNKPLSRDTLIAFAVIAILNAVSHIFFSITTGTLMPGVITAIAMVPVYSWVIYSLRKSR